jgi:hypothetical protein
MQVNRCSGLSEKIESGLPMNGGHGLHGDHLVYKAAEYSTKFIRLS